VWIRGIRGEKNTCILINSSRTSHSALPLMPYAVGTCPAIFTRTCSTVSRLTGLGK
jgi:hypothetical protein